MKRSLMALSAVLALAAAGAASAETHEVKMLNKGAEGMMVFEPAFVRAQPGDVIHFVAADKGHNAQSVKGMLPDGAEPFKGKMSQDLSITVEKEGLYGVKCLPHYALGMVALIQVGAPTNLKAAEAAEGHGRAARKFEKLFAKVK